MARSLAPPPPPELYPAGRLVAIPTGTFLLCMELWAMAFKTLSHQAAPVQQPCCGSAHKAAEGLLGTVWRFQYNQLKLPNDYREA